MTAQPGASAENSDGHRSADAESTLVGEVEFEAVVTSEPAGPVVAVHGEIDGATYGRLWDAIERAVTPNQRLVIDLKATTFMDSTGLSVLARAHQLLGGRRDALVVRAPNRTVRRLLALSGVDALVTIESGCR